MHKIFFGQFKCIITPLQLISCYCYIIILFTLISTNSSPLCMLCRNHRPHIRWATHASSVLILTTRCRLFFLCGFRFALLCSVEVESDLNQFQFQFQCLCARSTLIFSSSISKCSASNKAQK